MKATAKKVPMCSVSLIAMELKGLVALGEALVAVTMHRVWHDHFRKK